jgi:sporulation protein YlmC with PRC-barrel domain
LQEYYPWKSNWAGGGMGTSGMMTQVYEPLEEAIHNEYNKDVKPAIGDAELRSTSEIKGYSIHASDGKIGEVEDFIIDDSCWKLDFLVVDTGNWFPGKKVLISPKWIKEINWAEAAVMADATVEQVKNSPAYDADQPINELYKKTLHDYYGKLVPHEN